MIYVGREKIDPNSEISLQVIPSNCTEESVVDIPDDCIIELSLEERKNEARKPLYIKRI
ncbi:MAG: hypothetical protein NWF10_04865 [Candidatus Bathyarchaeota archaeon]|jgi:hypothetical protein|nr:hypothetical protein [Candidatus Bathyarchaeota archaeon]